jgi:hypothetical protein
VGGRARRITSDALIANMHFSGRPVRYRNGFDEMTDADVTRFLFVTTVVSDKPAANVSRCGAHHEQDDASMDEGARPRRAAGVVPRWQEAHDPAAWMVISVAERGKEVHHAVP